MTTPTRRDLLNRRRLLLAGVGFMAAGALPRALHAQGFDPSAIGRWLNGDQFPDYPPVPGNGAAADPRYTGTTRPLPGQPGPGQPAGPPPPGMEPDYPIPPVNMRIIPPPYRRQIVEYHGREWPGTIIVDSDNRFLYHVIEPGLAVRYGVGVGREGFEWSGRAKIGRKSRWPWWFPPKEMVERDPNARPWANGMPGGPDNPLGARALYLFDDHNKDTMFRIHGTNQPTSIGKAMSSGCIRMLNQDVAELYLRCPIGTRVLVLSSRARNFPTAGVATDDGVN
jgi:lipoprotein-anchoring transpeptidase ErfK/SrfK